MTLFLVLMIDPDTLRERSLMMLRVPNPKVSMPDFAAVGRSFS
jgi:hypothetical protein